MPRARPRTFNYDRNNRLVKERRPMGRRPLTHYNDLDQLIRETDAKSQNIEYGYDDAGRMNKIRHYKTGSSSPDKTVV